MNTLASWRRAYRCDCDGSSHKEGAQSYGATPGEIGVRRHLEVIQRVTGERPPTCPWRALYDPLVSEVLQTLSWAFESGNLTAVLPPDPPAILLEALGVYRRALEATENENEKLRKKKAEDEARIRRKTHG